MRAESIVFAIAGSLFGLIVGWILGSQQATVANRAAAAVAAQSPAQQSGAAPPSAAPAAEPLDETRAQTKRTEAEQRPADPKPRVELGNMYFDAERYTDAITWYEDALKINPADPNVSTDLGVAYYYTNQPDKAIAQFERSLTVDPRHTKTLLNMGIVKAQGKQDLGGAVDAFERVVVLAPDSPEGEVAKKALEGLRSAHASTPPGAGGQ